MTNLNKLRQSIEALHLIARELEDVQNRLQSLAAVLLQEVPGPGVSTQVSSISRPSSLPLPILQEIAAGRGLPDSQQSIIRAILTLEHAEALRVNTMLVAALSGLDVQSETFQASLKSLEERGHLSSSGSSLHLTEKARAIGLSYREGLTSEMLCEEVAKQLPRTAAIAFRRIANGGPKGSSRDEIVLACGRTRIDGTVLNALSSLSRLGLITKNGVNRYTCSEMLLLRDA